MSPQSYQASPCTASFTFIPCLHLKLPIRITASIWRWYYLRYSQSPVPFAGQILLFTSWSPFLWRNILINLWLNLGARTGFTLFTAYLLCLSHHFSLFCEFSLPAPSILGEKSTRIAYFNHHDQSCTLFLTTTWTLIPVQTVLRECSLLNEFEYCTI